MLIVKSRDGYAKRYKKTKYVFILLGVFWTTLGISQIVGNEFRVYTFILLVGGPLFIIQAILSEKNERGRYIILSNDGIKLKINDKKEDFFTWNEIINIKILNGRIHLKDSNDNIHSIRLNEYNESDTNKLIDYLKIFSNEAGFSFHNHNLPEE
jgi:hypothetical protein